MAAADAPVPYTELVRAAMGATGATNAAQLADALGYTGRNDPKKVGNWLAGTNAPSYDATMRMLAAVGWLNINGKVPRQQARPPKDHLEALAAGVGDLTEGQAEILRELGELKASIEAAPATRAGRPRRKRSTG